MTANRSITWSDANATLEELLASLKTDGPVEITRDGHTLAVLSAPAGPARPVEANRLAALASLYAAGKASWRDISAETGVAFGELLAELGRQGLALPRATPDKRPEQLALLEEVFQRATCS